MTVVIAHRRLTDSFFIASSSPALRVCRLFGSRLRSIIWPEAAGRPSRRGEWNALCAGRLRTDKGVSRNSHVKVPVGEDEVVARLRWIVHINRTDQSWQFIVNADPCFDEDPSAFISHDIG